MAHLEPKAVAHIPTSLRRTASGTATTTPGVDATHTPSAVSTYTLSAIVFFAHNGHGRRDEGDPIRWAGRRTTSGPNGS